MNERGNPGHTSLAGYHFGSHRQRCEDGFDAATDWFNPVAAPTRTAVGLLDSPAPEHSGAHRHSPAFPEAAIYDVDDAPTQQLHPFAPVNEPVGYQEHPSFPPGTELPAGTLQITPEDVYEVLGPDAEDLLADADVEVDELIKLLNAETMVMPPLVLPETDSDFDDVDDAAPEVAEAISTWKRRFLKGAVATLILTLTGAGGAAAAMDKSVTIEVDGKQRTIHTFEDTVGEVLAEEGIEVDPHDVLSPSPTSEIEQGETITLDRGRELTLTVDGEQRTEWVRSITVGQALRKLGVPAEGAWVSAKGTMPIPEEGMSLQVKTAKSITLVNGAHQPQELTTTAVTVEELLKAQGIKVDANDSVTPSSGHQLADGAVVRIERTGTTTIQVKMPIEPEVKEIVNNNMLVGERKVKEQGETGKKMVTFRVTTENGEEVNREAIGERMIAEAEPKVVVVGGKPLPGTAVWEKLAQCESGGNWHINTGNGYYGGLQFSDSTWDAYGGEQYAAYPHQATKAQQIKIATKLREARGDYGAWPACSAELGLPN